jgi:cytochrome d ubiquinol oxidase subunit I
MIRACSRWLARSRWKAATDANYAPLVLFGSPTEREERNDFEFSLPDIGSLIVTGSFDGAIRGLKEWPAADRPPVAWVFWAFRVMVGLGVLMLFIGWFGAWLAWRGTVERHRWFLRLCLVSGPAGFIAVLSGWFTAEIGRQPWTVQGLLRTADSVSPVTAGAVGMSLIVFVFVYTIVFSAVMLYMARLAIKGPVLVAPEPVKDKPSLTMWNTADPAPPVEGRP